MSESDTTDDGSVWPDDLEIGDHVKFDGDEYFVVGTGPGEATLERVDDDSITAEVFRWAFTDSVGIELETAYSQDEFGAMVETEDN
jgi:hypothetical protein